MEVPISGSVGALEGNSGNTKTPFFSSLLLPCNGLSSFDLLCTFTWYVSQPQRTEDLCTETSMSVTKTNLPQVHLSHIR